MVTSPSSPTILMVDDSPQDLSLLSDFLRDASLRLVAAFDGREGYELATVIQPDLILLDVRMPRTDGFAACRLLKADPRTSTIPVIFLSGCDELDDRLQGLGAGAVDFISKPFALDEVLARINIHLSFYRRLRGLEHKAKPAADDGRNSTVQAAMDMLLHDLISPPSMAVLAQQVGTSERRLTDLFRAATGMSVFAWLREQRFSMARQLLEEGELDIQQVSERVGYGSACNFTTMFRERLGVTPREYRQLHRHDRSGE